MKSYMDVLVETVLEDNPDYPAEVIYLEIQEGAEVTEEAIAKHVAAINAHAAHVSAITAGANALVVAHHIALGNELLKLKKEVRAAKKNWVEFADQHVKMKSRTREKAMFLASCEIDASFYAVGKERLYSVCKKVSDHDLKQTVSDIFRDLQAGKDLADPASVEDFKDIVDGWMKTQVSAFSATKKGNAAAEVLPNSEPNKCAACAFPDASISFDLAWDGREHSEISNTPMPDNQEAEVKTTEGEDPDAEREFIRCMIGIVSGAKKFQKNNIRLKAIKLEAIDNAIKGLEALKSLILSN